MSSFYLCRFGSKNLSHLSQTSREETQQRLDKKQVASEKYFFFYRYGVLFNVLRQTIAHLNTLFLCVREVAYLNMVELILCLRTVAHLNTVGVNFVSKESDSP